jgi:glycosyltransferase involved in cell wall biosynthesis
MVGLLSELARHPERPDGGIVAFVPRGLPSTVPGLSQIRLPRVPAPLFHGLEIQLRLPRDVRSVLYQSITPPVSRAGRVVVIHDLIYLSRPELFTPVERAYFGLIPRLLPRAEVVATVSEHVRRHVLDRFPRRDPGTVVVVPNGVDDRFFIADVDRRTQADDARSRLRLERPFVLAVGRINPRKNLGRLVRAFGRLGLADHLLCIAGPRDGRSDPDLDAALEAARPGTVRLLGEVPDDLLPGLYAASELTCYLSLEEGFGVPPLEAMAAGAPVLGSDIPVLREVAADAAAFVTPLDDAAIAEAIDGLLRDPAHLADLRARGKVRAAGYRWSRSAGAALAALRLAAELRGR